MTSPATTPTSQTRPPRPAREPQEWNGDGEAFYSRIPAVPTFIYWGIHALALGALVTKPTPAILAVAALAFWVRMLAITGVYHRYFSHKTYRTSRAFQFVLAVLGTSAVQKGPLWWAGTHRIHHRESDVPGKDPHSPRDGFWYSHAGWIQDPRWESTRFHEIRDFARYPELRWLNRWHFLAPVALAAGLWAWGGWPAFVWGFALSTVALWHSTYTINSLAHRWGTRRFETADDSRNNVWLALLTCGEGWHNNHHRYMASCRQGFRWWEVDATYYVLKGLEKLGLIWDVREPPAHLKRPTAGGSEEKLAEAA